jgi:hypothetical protein
MTDQTEERKPKRSIQRSPNYPAFSLREAIEKARVIYDQEKRSYTTSDVIAAHLGYNQAVGGPGGRALSAMRQYGLLDESEGKVRLSDAAYYLIHYPPDSPERIQATKAAIRKPALFNELLIEYKDGLPSDQTLQSTLLRRGFNPSVIADVIRTFRDTIAVDSGQNVSYPAILAGDYVQWEPGGADQFPVPQRVKRLSEDGKFAFFDGSETGVPVGELVKATAPSGESEDSGGNGKQSVIRRVAPKPGMNSDVFTLDEGEVVLQWPTRMSPESYEDFKDWLDLIVRKAKRAVEKKDSEAKQE